jgi:16S rRNA processing protein RimM
MRVIVGRIGRPHGVRGDAIVGVRTDEPEARFAVGARLDTDPAGVGPLTVAATRWHSGELVVRFTGINDRTAAGGLTGTWLSVDSGTLDELQDPDEFRDHQLVGLTVRTKDGEVVGVVSDVLHYGQDLLAIRPAAGSGGELLVPFVKAIVTDVDVAGGTIVIDPPPGLLNPDEAELPARGQTRAR